MLNCVAAQTNSEWLKLEEKQLIRHAFMARSWSQSGAG